jgi:hypothetical protein
MLAPPFELPDALLSLWLLYGGLWTVAGVVFVVCAWLRWLLGRWWGLALWPLEMSLWPEAPFLLSFGWHSVCVLSSSQMVDANVGIRSLMAIELQWKRKMKVGYKRQVALSDARGRINFFPLPQRSARAGLFVVVDQGTCYNALNAPNYLPRQQSTWSGGNLDYYIQKTLYNTPIVR